MLDATERTRPIMQYVRDLECRIRVYRNREMRFYRWWFILGCLCGATVTAAAFGAARLMLHLTVK